MNESFQLFGVAAFPLSIAMLAHELVCICFIFCVVISQIPIDQHKKFEESNEKKNRMYNKTK